MTRGGITCGSFGQSCNPRTQYCDTVVGSCSSCASLCNPGRTNGNKYALSECQEKCNVYMKSIEAPSTTTIPTTETMTTEDLTTRQTTTQDAIGMENLIYNKLQTGLLVLIVIFLMVITLVWLVKQWKRYHKKKEACQNQNGDTTPQAQANRQPAPPADQTPLLLSQIPGGIPESSPTGRSLPSHHVNGLVSNGYPGMEYRTPTDGDSGHVTNTPESSMGTDRGAIGNQEADHRARMTQEPGRRGPHVVQIEGETGFHSGCMLDINQTQPKSLVETANHSVELEVM